MYNGQSIFTASSSSTAPASSAFTLASGHDRLTAADWSAAHHHSAMSAAATASAAAAVGGPSAMYSHHAAAAAAAAGYPGASAAAASMHAAALGHHAHVAAANGAFFRYMHRHQATTAGPGSAPGSLKHQASFYQVFLSKKSHNIDTLIINPNQIFYFSGGNLHVDRT